MSNNNSGIVMYNHELQKFTEFLLSLEVNARNSRMRSRFLKIATERLTELEEERIAMLNRHAKKDEQGNPIIRQDENGNKTYDLKDINAFLEEYNGMMAEEFRVDYLPERKDMLIAIKDIVLNIPDNVTFSGKKALEYDRWCEIVEGIVIDE